MNFIKRIFFLCAVNLLVMLTISSIVHFINLQPYLSSHGLNYRDLMIFCLLWGFGGAFISLALSRIMARWIMGVSLVDPNSSDPKLQSILKLVNSLARAAHLPEAPQVGIYESSEVNAFATGPSRKRSLLALSSRIMELSDSEIKGIIGHEISHIANGDMVTITLLQGLINAFVMFLARVVAFFFLNSRKERGSSSQSYHLFVFVFELVFMALGFLVIAAYSRFREFRADKGSAEIAGRQNMIEALRRLARTESILDPRSNPASYQMMKIRSGRRSHFSQLFATHPTIESRIKRLEGASIY